jgi:hypothetical protein
MQDKDRIVTIYPSMFKFFRHSDFFEELDRYARPLPILCRYLFFVFIKNVSKTYAEALKCHGRFGFKFENCWQH